MNRHFIQVFDPARVGFFMLVALTTLFATRTYGQFPNLIPLPKSPQMKLDFQEGKRLGLAKQLTIRCHSGRLDWREHLTWFAEIANRLTGIDVSVVTTADNSSRHSGGNHNSGGDHNGGGIQSGELSRDSYSQDSSLVKFIDVYRSDELSQRAYKLNLHSGGIAIHAANIKSLANATATLAQILGQTSVKASKAHGGESSEWLVPEVSFHDQPSHGYRSLMIDMGRNPHDFDLLLETIDLLWFYKLDSLHLHLTDDQRFAFPSTAFPTLWDGLITLDQFQSLERYARIRGITIIPELDVPGHSTQLRNRYPETFGKSPTDVAKLASSRLGLKTLLSEMSSVFQSSPYIHVGGDEAYGVPEELQRDLINDLNDHVKSLGKATIVWEGPSAGDPSSRVAKEVIHMNWRTINYPADQMIANGHRVINAAWDPLYLVDHYPQNNFTMASPRHIFESLDARTFKHFNPDIQTYKDPVRVSTKDAQNSVIGFCMPWWEGRQQNFMPLVVPRLIPMAQIAWSGRAGLSPIEFEQSTIKTESVRRHAFYPVHISAKAMAVDSAGVFHNQTTVTLTDRWSQRKNGQQGSIRYTFDGSQPTLYSHKYQQPFTLKQSAVIRAALFEDDKRVGSVSQRAFKCVQPISHLALGKKVRASVPSGPVFSAARLTDGDTDNLGFFLGYRPDENPIEITVDLESAKSVSRIVINTYQNGDSYESFTLQVSSDGSNYRTIVDRTSKPDKPSSKIEQRFQPVDIQFVRVLSYGHKGQVFDSFSRITEIQVHP